MVKINHLTLVQGLPCNMVNYKCKIIFYGCQDNIRAESTIFVLNQPVSLRQTYSCLGAGQHHVSTALNVFPQECVLRRSAPCCLPGGTQCVPLPLSPRDAPAFIFLLTSKLLDRAATLRVWAVLVLPAPAGSIPPVYLYTSRSAARRFMINRSPAHRARGDHLNKFCASRKKFM